MGTNENRVKKNKERDWTEFRYYAVPEDTHMLALQGDEWIQCFGEGVESLHFHNHMEIGYCYYGEGEMLIGDQVIPFREGTCTMIPRNIPHTTKSRPGTLSRWEYIFADVEGLADRIFAGKRIMRDRAVRLLNGTAYVLEAGENEEISRLIRAILKNYGIPFDNGASITCLRTDYLEQAGFTVEDFTDITWSEFIEKGKKVLEVTGNPMLTAQAGMPDLIMEMLQSCGASCFNEDGSLNMVGNEALKVAMETYSELVDSGVLVEVTDNDQYIASLNNGTTVGTVNGCWILASVQAQEDQSGKWAVTNIPALDGVENATNYSNNGGSSWVITSNCKNPDLAIDFMNSTFAGSQEFYETILPSSGALSTWLPAGESDVYNEPQEFFGGQAIYADIVEFAGKIPSNITGPFYYDARDAIGVALSNITQSGADIDSEIQAAQDTVEFNMGG